jgi:hypothetical protein
VRRRGGPAQRLRWAIDCLPYETREAMLGGIRESEIIVGAYTDRSGGVCPMLAAHRRGGRTNFSSFARAWDRYTHAGRRSRRASERELRTLESMLEASIGADRPGSDDFAGAIAAHAESRARRAETGERDRTDELAHQPGWAWMRPFRRYDHYEAAMERLGELEAQVPRQDAEAAPAAERELVG